mmetsp:Transcript_22111/g.32958  ORF Transcript_22111/g.32958 Transcript_22111/m.32958 type:complete len:109 (+) Transcript_22111:15-341(+)
MAEKALLLGDDSGDIEAQKSCIEMFKTSYTSLNLDFDENVDLRSEMKKHGINIDLVPEKKKIKDMTDKELEDYGVLIDQISSALAKLSKKLVENKNIQLSEAKNATMV